ncbi:MAG: ATP-grasp domain-containing protein [Bacteroidales bacterium]|nr:ATP-grasp domain-containing protein [Bacteroidales bacterium]
MKQKVVIIGHGYTSRLGIIRSLAELDCEITVIAMVFHGWLGRHLHFYGGKPIDCNSKYVHRMFYCYAKSEQGLMKLLLEKCSDPTQKVIIIPDSDFSAAAIDRNQEKLKEHFLFPHINNTLGAVEHWMSKSIQKSLAQKVGLNVAQGQILTIKNGHYVFPEKVNYPCFTKPLATISGGKQFLKRCNDESELRKILDSVSQRYDTEVLIEDFKKIDVEYAVVGFSDGNDVVIPGVIEFIVNSKSHFGIAREGKIMPIKGFESLLEQFKEFVRQIGFCGLFDIDFYESDGKMYFGEMNLRFGGSGYAYTAMGANLPAMMVKCLRGESYSDKSMNITQTAIYANERMCVDDWEFNHITETQMRQIIEKANIHFVFDNQDLGPQKKLERYIRLHRIKRKIRKVLKK